MTSMMTTATKPDICDTLLKLPSKVIETCLDNGHI